MNPILLAAVAVAITCSPSTDHRDRCQRLCCQFREELRRLRAELTGKEQEMMEMCSTREKRRE